MSRHTYSTTVEIGSAELEVEVVFSFFKGSPASYHALYGWSPPDRAEVEPLFLRAWLNNEPVGLPAWLEKIILNDIPDEALIECAKEEIGEARSMREAR
jgi:hypothetical protein